MHFSLPDTEEARTEGGSGTFMLYHLHVNGSLHAAVRYSQMHSFQEKLKKEFGTKLLPHFPPKKFLGLSPGQAEERRSQLERYIQILSQNNTISRSETFTNFLLTSQQLTHKQKKENAALAVYLSNGYKISVEIMAVDNTKTVLEAVASHIHLPDDLVEYFGLFLMKKGSAEPSLVVRQLQNFEAPLLSLRTACKQGEHQIVLRKRYWDAVFDEDLMDNRVSLNLLYVQVVSEVERGWAIGTAEQRQQLDHLKNNKKEYLRYGRKNLRYYGHVHFKPCECDYPQLHTPVLISAGNRELHFRHNIDSGEFKETLFKVSRMKCWRITTTIDDPDRFGNSDCTLELAFEYLLPSGSLQWVTVVSDQAILMSMCIQTMVEELIMKKQGLSYKQLPSSSTPSLASLSSVVTPPTTPPAMSPTASKPPVPLAEESAEQPVRKTLVKQVSNRSTTSVGSFSPSISFTDGLDNDDGIGDDDL